jgi:hypothetical protein
MMHALIRRGVTELSVTPVDAVSGGNDLSMEPPLIAALFHFAHIRKEVAKR